MSKNDRLICIVQPDSFYVSFWGQLGRVVSVADFLADPEMVDLLAFTGGEDVSPYLYKHKNLASHCSPERDRRELELVKLADKYNIPMTGICRGSQFLNVVAGGTMVQHLGMPHGGSNHLCHTLDGHKFEVTSSHHQMIVPSDEALILAWAEEQIPVDKCTYADILPNSVLDAKDDSMVQVTESYAYPNLRIFGVQHHPEWQDLDAQAGKWTLRMTRKYCWGEEERCETV